MKVRIYIALIILASTIAGGPRVVVATGKTAEFGCENPETLTSLSSVSRGSDRNRCFSIQAASGTGVIRFWLRPADDGVSRYNLYLGESGQPLALKNQSPIDSTNAVAYWFSAPPNTVVSYTLIVAPVDGTPAASMYALDVTDGAAGRVPVYEPCPQDEVECDDVAPFDGPVGVRIEPSSEARFPFLVTCDGDISLWASWTHPSHDVSLALYDAAGVRRITWYGPSDRPVLVTRSVAMVSGSAAWWEAALINGTGQAISGLVQPRLACAAPSGTVTYQAGRAPYSGYAGADDATIKQSWPTGTFGEKVECQVDGDGEEGNSADYATLLRWQLDSIVRGVQVTGVTMTLSVYDGSEDSYAVYPVLRPWNEAQVSWERAGVGLDWSASGASGAGDRRTASIGSLRATGPGLATVTLNRDGIALVQHWLDDPASNNGILIANTSVDDGLDFHCNEASDPASRPSLSISFRQP